ncbi:MAG TPA: hypothetical protein VGC32_04345 [Solirubrobacterales bacterium]
MGLFDPTTRKLTRLGFGVAGALIGAFGRRGRVGSRRSPERLPVEGVAGVEARAELDREEPASSTEHAERAAWERFVIALEKLTAVQAAYALDPDDLGAERVRWAEVDLEDAVAVAGEFEVKNIRWLLT